MEMTTSSTVQSAVGAAVQQATEVAREVTPTIKAMAQEMLTWLKEGKEFATEQAPLFAHDIISWGIAYNSVWVIIGLVEMLAAIWAYNFLRKAIWDTIPEAEKQGIWDDATGFAWMFTFCPPPVVGFIGFCTFFNSLLDLVKPLFAPRVFLIEYLSNLVR